jgi:uncharacterized protein (TIGR03437 family)
MTLLTVRGFFLGLCFLAIVPPAWSQGTINTIAGCTWAFTGDGGPATQAPLGLGGPRQAHGGPIPDVAVDSAGNVFVADPKNFLVVKIAPSGILTVIAGNGREGFSGDGGPATAASLMVPSGLAVDSAGSLYIADNCRIRKIDGQGTIRTLAGSGTCDDAGDGGAATAASLYYPQRVAVDAGGNVYIPTRNRIRKVTAGGISTIAGNGQAGFSGDGGPATAASLNFNAGAVAVDAAGNLYIADDLNNRVRKVDRVGVITTVSSGRFYLARAVAIDAPGSLYIAEQWNFRVLKLSPDGATTTFAGNGVRGFSGDGGPALAASMGQPNGVAVDSAGNVYIADGDSGRIRKVSTNGTIYTLAGNGLFKFSGDGGAATQACLDYPSGVAVDGAGNVYIADTLNNRIRRIGPSGVISTVAGNGVAGYSGDGGPATAASLAYPEGPMALDAAGNLYFTDTGNHCVRRVSPDGTISTVAGSGVPSATGAFSGDGRPATAARLFTPIGVALDAAGNLYIADHFNSRIRKVDVRGGITTTAGNGVAASSGDGGPATAASIYYPTGIAVDAAGNLYTADCYGHRVRKIDAAGMITTVAGTGTAGVSADGGPATASALSYPFGVAVDPSGNLYILDSTNRVRKVAPNATITAVAGSSTGGLSGDGGPATQASLYSPSGVALDAAGNLFIADSGNDRIRFVAVPPPVINASGVVNAASYTAPVSPGGIASLFGSNLAGSTAVAALPLPTLLGGVTVKINGVAAPLFFVSPSQINFQVPWELLGQAQGSIAVTLNGVTSSSQTINLGPAPGLFSVNSQGSGQGAILVANSDIVAALEGSIPGRNTRPAKRGEFLSIFCSGLGDVTNRPLSGTSPSSSVLSATTSTPTVRIGGMPAAAVFSGLAPGFVGLYQVNVQVPDSAPTGAAVPVVLTIGGASSNSVTIAVQ